MSDTYEVNVILPRSDEQLIKTMENQLVDQFGAGNVKISGRRGIDWEYRISGTSVAAIRAAEGKLAKQFGASSVIDVSDYRKKAAATTDPDIRKALLALADS